MHILVTGGAGFIGSHVVEHLVRQGHQVTVFDRLSYAGKLRNLDAVLDQITVLEGDLTCPQDLRQIGDTKPQVVVHVAAETHVDRAIAHPERFVKANVLGTTYLLDYLRELAPQKILVYSTDEVYGSTPDGVHYTEYAPFRPSNAYSASKVGVEAMVHAFWTTHQLPIVVVRPCNTYGSRQHPEKVIPRFVQQALRGQPLTLYNDGLGSRDWLHTSDHVRAVETLIYQGRPGAAYNLAAGCEHTDAEIATRIGEILCRTGCLRRAPEVSYTPGRPGHDRRYAMEATRLRNLGWFPTADFDTTFATTVLWNVNHPEWWEPTAPLETETIRAQQVQAVLMTASEE